MLESGATRAQMRVASRGMVVLSQALAAPDGAAPDILAGLLWRLGFFDVAAPQEDNSRSCWEFHDLLMHETSRFNRDLPGALRPPALGRAWGVRLAGRAGEPAALEAWWRTPER